MIHLTKEEYIRFNIWCKEQAESSTILLKQTNSVKGLEPVAQMIQKDIDALYIVGKKLMIDDG